MATTKKENTMGKFVIKESNKKFRFNLHAGNNQIVARCTHGYLTRDDCEVGIEEVKANANAKTVDLSKGESGTSARFEIYASSSEFRFRLVTKDDKKLLASEGYASKQGCKNGIKSVRNNAPKAIIE